MSHKISKLINILLFMFLLIIAHLECNDFHLSLTFRKIQNKVWTLFFYLFLFIFFIFLKNIEITF